VRVPLIMRQPGLGQRYLHQVNQRSAAEFVQAELSSLRSSVRRAPWSRGAISPQSRRGVLNDRAKPALREKAAPSAAQRLQ
jgi:hypothetical protein